MHSPGNRQAQRHMVSDDKSTYGHNSTNSSSSSATDNQTEEAHNENWHDVSVMCQICHSNTSRLTFCPHRVGKICVQPHECWHCFKSSHRKTVESEAKDIRWAYGAILSCNCKNAGQCRYGNITNNAEKQVYNNNNKTETKTKQTTTKQPPPPPKQKNNNKNPPEKQKKRSNSLVLPSMKVNGKSTLTTGHQK